MNFGVTLVVSSKEKLVIARDVLAAGPQPQPTLVTVIITLMHIAKKNPFYFQLCKMKNKYAYLFIIYLNLPIKKWIWNGGGDVHFCNA